MINIENAEIHYKHYISEFFKCQYGECIKEGEDL
jgi:hypothetical protein